MEERRSKKLACVTYIGPILEGQKVRSIVSGRVSEVVSIKGSWVALKENGSNVIEFISAYGIRTMYRRTFEQV